MTRPAPINAMMGKLQIDHQTAEGWQVFVNDEWVGNVSLLPNHMTRFGGEYEARRSDGKIIGYFESLAAAAAAIQKSLDAT